ncbi:MAG: aminopeptidase [Candidatus Gracilibacteria bacterium]
MAGINVRHVQEGLTSSQPGEGQQTGWFQDRVRQSTEGLGAIDAERDLSEAIDTVYRARNLVRLKLSGINVEEERLIPLADDSLRNVPKLPLDESLIKGVAKRLFESARRVPGGRLMIAGNKRNIQIMEEIARLCIAGGTEFGIDIVSDELEAALVNGATDEGLEALGKEYCDFYWEYPARAEARGNPDPDIKFNPDRLTALSKQKIPFIRRLQAGEMHYCLTIVPTPADASLDGLDYEAYMKLFFEACDQPWNKIEEAQEKLVERFDAGKKVHITNEDGTDLIIDIEGMTFVNSVTLKNVPGSEVFSAPVKEGVNGKLVSKGKFKYENYSIIEDITLEFENGRVVAFDARVGRDILEKIITADDGRGEGTRFAGEFAVGTNPGLRRHSLNGLLVEKIGGSFHLALGSCYSYKTYNGKPVKLDNGNVSGGGIHWDLTTMLSGNNGEMELDGKVIQVNGIWVDEAGNPDESLSVLNEGWAALPEGERPEWFKKEGA